MNITIIVGPPGSGKTTLATRLHKESGAYVIHSDDYIKRGEEAFVDRIRLATNSDVDIIVEGCWTVKVLSDLVLLDANIHIIKMDTPLDICKQRYENRESKEYPAGMFGMVHGGFDKFMQWIPVEVQNKLRLTVQG